MSLSALLLVLSSARAEPPVVTPDQVPPPAPFHEPSLRYPHAGVLKRTAVDIIAIPAGVPTWDAGDWALFSTFGALTLGGMLPTDPSPDVRLDRWITRNLDPTVPDIWGFKMQAVLWSGLAVGSFGTWGVARLADWPRVAEGMSLTGEALAVTQFYHIAFKLAIGREGPTDGDGLGLVLGPAESFRLFPAGTPGGHSATLYSMLGALEGYWAPPWPVSVGAHTVVGGLIVMHVVNHRHFLSDAIWGSAMGYAIGRWVVRHRSSRFAYHQGQPLRVGLAPWSGPEVQGLVLVVAW